ncbi:glycosyltransferase family 4 protein [Loktanella salsilacus]|uniref:glycosyltransferase family 4 protein n=1 Tax=Loktanella salsilacus TaxID=195913 RepID=UPI003734EA31
MSRHIAFVTTGDIESIATSKRAFGMAGPLARRGFDVSIMLEDTPSNRARLSLEAPMAKAHWFPRTGAIKELRTKRKILRKIRPDVVYVGSYGIRNIVSPLRPVKATYLVEHSELPSAILNQSKSRRMLDFVLERLALDAFDGQVCASHYLMDFVRSRLSSDRHDGVLYSPYAFTREVLLPDESTVRRSQMDGPKQLLYMGTLAPNYGILHILQAMAYLRQRLDVKLVVLGKGRAYETAVAKAKELGIDDIVDFKGYVPEDGLPECLGQADAFVAPIFDTVQDIARCPSKMFMYVAYDRPIVTSEIGEAAALFGKAYEFYFEPGNVIDMAARLEDALTCPPDWTPDWSSADHEWDARTEKFDQWLLTLLSRKR